MRGEERQGKKLERQPEIEAEKGREKNLGAEGVLGIVNHQEVVDTRALAVAISKHQHPGIEQGNRKESNCK